jgi:hypothetical protein
MNNTTIASIDLTKILFLDIETVPQHVSVSELSEAELALWNKKSQRLREEDMSDEDLYKKAGIFAEFGKIVCISVAYMRKVSNEYELRVRSFYDDDERKLLTDFMELVNMYFNTKKTYFCAHNGYEFDFPYIARRALILGIKVPSTLDTRGKKPWEIQHLDTLDLWRFADYKNYTSLALLAHVFGIPTPKDDIDGSQVGDVYWKENNLQRIATYCQKDVVTVAQLFRKYRSEELIPENKIIYV